MFLSPRASHIRSPSVIPVTPVMGFFISKSFFTADRNSANSWLPRRGMKELMRSEIESERSSAWSQSAKITCTTLGATIRNDGESPTWTACDTSETCVCSLMSPLSLQTSFSDANIMKWNAFLRNVNLHSFKAGIVAVTTVCVFSGTRGARLRCGWTTLASSTTRLVPQREGSPTESKKRVISL